MEKIKNASELAKMLGIVGSLTIKFNEPLPIEYTNNFLNETENHELKGIRINESSTGKTVADVFSDKRFLRFNDLSMKNKQKVVQEILKNINN